MACRLRGAHGLAFSLDAVRGEPSLEGAGRIRREVLADSAEGGSPQLRPPLQEVIDPAAQVADDILDVVRVLQPPLDLEAQDARVGHCFQMIGEVQIPDAQQVLVPQEHAARGVHQVPGGAAGLGAFPAVAAAITDGAAQVAVAALAHAQGTIDEGLQFDIGGLVDGLDVIEAQLPGEDGPAKARTGEEGHPLRAVAGRLGAGVQGQGRQVQLQVGHVLDDEGVHSRLVQVPGLASGVFEFRIEEQGVEGGKDLRPPQAGLGGEPLEIRRIVARRLPGSEPRPAHVHRIRPAA